MSQSQPVEKERITIVYLIVKFYDWLVNRLDRTGWLAFNITLPKRFVSPLPFLGFLTFLMFSQFSGLPERF